jgi:hypothetical protein
LSGPAPSYKMSDRGVDDYIISEGQCAG